MKPTINILILLILTNLSVPSFAQKHFHLTVEIPKSINKQKLEAWLDDGKKVQKIKALSIKERQVVYAGDYYFVYAVITLQYPDEDSISGFAKDFFIGEKPAVISFSGDLSSHSSYSNYSIQNVLVFDDERKKMNDYCAKEINKAVSYQKQYGDRLFSGNDTAIQNYFFNTLVVEVGKKRLEYIEANKDSYFSFYTFRSDVAKQNIVSADSLLFVFNTFPDRFKFSDEGNYLNTFLYGKALSANRNNVAIDFVTRDINKKTVTLSQFKRDKCVLLHFWATWCSPCMQEVPALKKISEQYNSRDLQIISIASPSSKYEDYLATIKKFGMDWINIYNDEDLIVKYGNQPIPRIYLIDKNGELKYYKLGFVKEDDLEWRVLKAKIKELLN